jgi:hypothetical protein
VDTSISGSSNSTVSPTFFSQDPIVPSATVSPSFGIVMSWTMWAAPSASAAGRPAAAGGSDADAGGEPASEAAGAAGAAPGVDPGAPILTNSVPMGTVSPAATMICRITPS